ncbi:hypothetical protein [Lysobacter antibioticus]|uniref:Uncharacterized protein n=1 Tax=Lysobacter antibioticus TaxID=84531 RepID=A0A0S2FBL5_LYSAN|nr:hypothetical protein [Lysobacter antibioticus]ALN80943.1 hypothetical protein LA76x_2813 [Lysobacter antibioticus]
MSARNDPAGDGRGPARPRADADGFLDRVVARTRQQAPLLTRRRPSLFEPRSPSGPAPDIVETIVAAPEPAPMASLARPSAIDEHVQVENAPALPRSETALPVAAPTLTIAASAPAPLSVPATLSAPKGSPYRRHNPAIHDESGSAAQRHPQARANRSRPIGPTDVADAPESKPRSERSDHVERVARVEHIERVERLTRIEHTRSQAQAGAARAATALHTHEQGAEPQRLSVPAALPSPMSRRRDAAPAAPVANPGRAAAMSLAPVASSPAPIHVTIGRLEVGAVAPSATAGASAPGPTREPKLGLDDYLRRRHGGRP